MNGIQEVMSLLRKQREAIEEAILGLERVFGPDGEAAPAWLPTTKTATKKAATKRGMTPAGRKRLAEAMRKRWAVKRAAATAKKRGRAKKAA